MSSKLAGLKSTKFLAIILFLQFILYVTMFLDVPIARQVVGFVYFTFFPGFVIIKILRLDELDGLETLLFSVGFSVAFLMLAGLLMNEFCLLFGISKPLSFLPLTIILNGLVLVGGVLAALRNEGTKPEETKNLGLHPSAIFLICLPVLSVIGAACVNAYNNNSVLLFTIIAISLLFVIAVVSKKLLPPKLYPLAIFVIASSLLFHCSLISNYITTFGSDVSSELFTFRTVQKNAYWKSANPYYPDTSLGRVHSMLSVTILPTIYSNLLNLDPTWVFKFLYPLIFSFVPLGLYTVWKEGFGSKYAFISVFLFTSEVTFYTEMLGLNRQMIAELFFVLLLFAILNKKMKSSNKMKCFFVFSVSLVISHYALAEIFAFFISFALILSLVMKRPKMSITISMVTFFLVVMFSWYIYTSSSAGFDSLLYFGDYIYNSLGDFFNPAAREPFVMRGLGLEAPPTIWNAISRGFAYATELLIIAGLIGLITKRIKINLNRALFIFSLIATLLLALIIVVPGLAGIMNMTRFYHLLLFFLAPLSAIGAELLVGLVFKGKRKPLISIVLLIIFVPYFLFQTGFVYEVTGSDSWSLPLSKHRMDVYRLRVFIRYVDEWDVFSAQWILKNVDIQNTQIYADRPSRGHVLTCYGMINRNNVELLTNTTSVAENGTIYLSILNTIEEVIIGTGKYWNTTEISFLNFTNKIYSNGGSAILKSMDTDSTPSS